MAIPVVISCPRCPFMCRTLPIPFSFAMDVTANQDFKSGMKMLSGEVAMFYCQRDERLIFAEMQEQGKERRLRR